MTIDRAWFLRRALGPLAAILLAASSTGPARGLEAPAAPAPAASAEGSPAPVLAPIASAPQRADAVLPINIRITCSTGVGRAVLWFLGEHDAVFRPFPMRRLEGDVFTARLGVWKSRGNEVRYYVEAWDGSNERNAALGDRNTPFVVKLAPVPATAGTGIGGSTLWIGTLCAALLGAWWCGIRVRRRLPPPAPVIAEESPAGYRVMPIVVRAAGSMPAETVYLRFQDEGAAGAPAPVRFAPRPRGFHSRKSRLAYRRKPEDDDL